MHGLLGALAAVALAAAPLPGPASMAAGWLALDGLRAAAAREAFAGARDASRDADAARASAGLALALCAAGREGDAGLALAAAEAGLPAPRSPGDEALVKLASAVVAFQSERQQAGLAAAVKAASAATVAADPTLAARCFLLLAERGPEASRRLAALRALEAAERSGASLVALRCALLLASLDRAAGRPEEGLAWLTAAVEATPVESAPRPVLEARLEEGRCRERLLRLDAAVHSYEAARLAARADGDPLALERAAGPLAYGYDLRGRRAEARAVLEEALRGVAATPGPAADAARERLQRGLARLSVAP